MRHVMPNVNVRRQRALHLAYEVFRLFDNSFRPYLNEMVTHRQYADFRAELEALFNREGVELLTDAMREEAGLPPRGPDGWTVEELIALEQNRISRLLSPPFFVIPSKPEKS